MKISINALSIRRGGGLTVVRGLIQGLRETAPDCEICVLTSDARTFNSVSQLGAADQIDRVLPNAGHGRLFLWQKLFLRRWLKRRGTDVLVSVNHYLQHVACPQVVYHLNLLRFCNSYRPNNVTAAFKEWLRDCSAQRALRCSDANVFESRYLQETAENASGSPARNAHVIYAGLPQELHDLGACLARTKNESRRIVCITSPNPHKDNATLIQTLGELVAREPDIPWRLDMIGGESLEAWASLRQLADRRGVADRITWHGYCDVHKMTEVLRASLCLVSTSRLESFAMVALEAMSRGCPPIVANCAAMPESVGGAGLLAEPGSARSFADAVLAIAHQPGLRDQLVLRGQAWITQFRWSTCGQQFFKLFRNLAREGGTSQNRAQAA